jgi:arsenite methyltransferase
MTIRERLADALSGIKARLYGGPRDTARDKRTEPERVIEALALIGGERVADIGSGGGYYTFRLARSVGPTGLIYAVDVDAGLLRRIAKEADEEGLSNVRTVEAGPDEPNLPEPVDLMFASASYHHIPDRVGYFRRADRNLKPGGRIAIIEMDRQGLARILGHSTPPGIIRDELGTAGYRLVETHEIPRGSSFQIFRRDGGNSAPTERQGREDRHPE